MTNVTNCYTSKSSSTGQWSEPRISVWILASATASFNKVDHTSEEISSKLKDISFTLNTVLSENAELKKQNRELKTMITHVMEEDDEK